MATLDQITFTGIDDRTDPDALIKIWDDYPMVEWGVLASLNWWMNGPRFLQPALWDNLSKLPSLSVHFCGKLAKDALADNWSGWRGLSGKNLHSFERFQLNVSGYHPYELMVSPDFDYHEFFHECIVQTKSAGGTVFRWLDDGNVSVVPFIDTSGGLGQYTGLKPTGFRKCGYAGGLNAENIVDAVRTVLDNPVCPDQSVWLDMESGVRTNDRFDTTKVLEVLHRLEDAGYIEKYRPKLDD